MDYSNIKATSDDELPGVLDLIRREYPCEITGDACVGDEIAFVEAKFTGSHRKPKFSHYEVVAGRIVKDSYGEKAQQHTFTIELGDGDKVRRMGRNVYRNGTFAKRRDPGERKAALAEKHARGKAAREEKELRFQSRFVA